MMKEEQIKNYLADSSDCPFCGCGSEAITAISVEYEEELVYVRTDEYRREVVCSSCGKSWREYYRLHDIEELDADGCAIPNEAGWWA